MLVAVYGTLRVGEYNYERFKDGVIDIIAENVKIPNYEMFDLGSYPGVRKSMGVEIVVDIINFGNDTYEQIEKMELGAGYKMTYVDTPVGMDIVMFTYNRPGSYGLPIIESGDWKLYNMEKNYKRKIYVVGNSGSYTNWMEGQSVKTMEEADLIVFTGGEDVNPDLYGENEGYQTYYSVERDIREIKEYEKARELGKPMVGVCRGSQFLCVMNGGKLIQHMEHPGGHDIITSDGQILEATSTHHQMQLPYGLPNEDYKLLGWADELSKCHLNGDNQNINFPKHAFKDNRIMEPEIVLYPKTKCLGIQMHPEYWIPTKSHPTLKYLRGLLNELVGEPTAVVSENKEVKVTELPF